MNQKQIMLQRFQRLQHSEEERASPAMLGKQGQTAQAVKRTYQRKQILHENMNSAQNVRKRLLFDDTAPKATLHNVSQQITSELRHQVAEQNEDENVGVTAAVQVEQTGESLLHKGEQLYQHRQVRASKERRKDSTLQRLATCTVCGTADFRRIIVLLSISAVNPVPLKACSKTAEISSFTAVTVMPFKSFVLL